MKRNVWIGLAGAAALLAVVAVGLLGEYDAPRIGRAALDLLSTPEMHVTAERFRLSPLRGIELGNARVAADLPGGRLRVEADALVLELRFWPLLTGRLIADELVVRSPRVELTTNEAAAPASAPASASAEDREKAPAPDAETATGGPRLRIDRIRIDNGELVLRGAGDETPTRMSGVDLELRDVETADPEAPLLGLSATGSLDAETVETADVSGQDLEGAIELGDGHLRLSDLELDAEQGHFRLPKVDLDLAHDPYRYDFDVESDPLHTDRLLGVTSGGFGEGTLRFQATGAGEPADAFEGQGTLRIAGGTLPANPTLSAIAALLGDDGLLDRRYQPVEISFRIDGDTLELTPFDLSVDDTVIRFSGSLLLSGPLDLRATLETPRERVDTKEVPKELLDALETDQGRVRVPLAIRGTASAPRVAPASDLLLESGRRAVEKRFGREAGKAIGRLLGGDDETDETDETNEEPPPR